MAGRGSPPGVRRGGRAKGTPNKINGDLKAMILGALAGAGGEAYLQRQAEQNPAAFMTLVGKVLPLQLANSDGGPVLIITGVLRSDGTVVPDETTETDAPSHPLTIDYDDLNGDAADFPTH